MTKVDAELDAGDIRADGDECDLIRRSQQAARRTARHINDGGGDEPPSSAHLPDEVLKLLQTQLTVGPEIAGQAFGLGRTAAYAACHKGEIPALRIGTKIVVPTARLRQMLGIEPSLLPSPQQPTPLPPPTPKPVKSPRRRRR